MSIRDFDPLFKKRAAQEAARGTKSAQAQANTDHKSKVTTNVGQPDIPPTSYPTRINIGRAYIRADGDSADALAISMQEAFKEVTSSYTDYVKQLEGYMPNDLMLALQPTLELAAYYCPKDTEALVNSRYIAVEAYRGGCRVEMGFAKGNDPDYAVYVHEMPYKHEAPTCDKFMQRAIDEDYFNVVQRVTDYVAIRTGG
jgi:hypothetical protein